MSRSLSLLLPLAALLAIGSPAALQSKAVDPAITGCGFDIAFVLDRSESVTEINFPLVKSFVKNVIGSLMSQLKSHVGNDGVQIALVPFNTQANVALYLNQAQSITDVLAAVDALQYFPGLTNPYAAMDKVVNDVFTSAHGDRADQTNALIFVSDGSRTEGTMDPAPLARQFRDSQNGQIIAVGVNGLNGMHEGVFYDELLSLAGTASNVFNVTSYSGLFGVFKEVATSLNC